MFSHKNVNATIIGTVPLPTGSATAAKQDTGNTTLASILAKIIAAPATEATLAAIQTLLGGTGAVKDNGPAWTSAFGIAGIAFTSADATTAAAVTSAPTGGQKLVITDLIVSSDTAMFLLFHEESTAGTVIFKVFIPANGTVQITPRGKVKLPTADKKLMVDASAAGNIAVTACYYSEA